MTYDPKKIFKQAETAIKKHNLFFIEDIVAFIPCNRDSFYRFFPTGSDKYESLKALLDENKVVTKSSIRSKLYRGTRATELIALYKLICTDEERKALSMNFNEHTIKSEQPLFPDVSENDSD